MTPRTVRRRRGGELPRRVNAGEQQRKNEWTCGACVRLLGPAVGRFGAGRELAGHHEAGPRADQHGVVGDPLVVATDRARAAPPAGCRPRRRCSARRSPGRAPSGGRPSRRPCRAAPRRSRPRWSAKASTARFSWIAGLGAHALDQPTDPRRQLARVQAPGGLGDRDREVGGELDLLEDPQHGEQRAQVAGHRLLGREHLVDAVLERLLAGRRWSSRSAITCSTAVRSASSSAWVQAPIGSLVRPASLMTSARISSRCSAKVRRVSLGGSGRRDLRRVVVVGHRAPGVAEGWPRHCDRPATARASVRARAGSHCSPRVHLRATRSSRPRPRTLRSLALAPVGLRAGTVRATDRAAATRSAVRGSR